jgi:hypothetical protein
LWKSWNKEQKDPLWPRADTPRRRAAAAAK